MRGRTTGLADRGSGLSRAIAAIAVIATVVGTVAAATAWSAYDGATAANPPKFIGRPAAGAPKPSDSFLSYDGVDGSDNQNTRDWPITAIWRKSATKYKVKHGLTLDQESPVRKQVRGALEIYLAYKKRSGSGKRRTNNSMGGKSECPSQANPKDVHVRFYGSNAKNTRDSMFYDPSTNGWRFFVVTSAHYDYAEETDKPKITPKGETQQVDNPCWGHREDKWGGLSERATREIEENYVQPRSGLPSSGQPFGQIQCDQFATKNFEGNTTKGPGFQPPCGKREPPKRVKMSGNDQNHRWQNDGLATLIEVH